MHASDCRRLGRRTLLWAAVVGWVAVIGCGRRIAPADAPVARQSLATALESWKAGDQPSKIREGSPSITMVDSAWNSGQKLESFEVVGPDVESGVNLTCPVKLVLKDTAGKQSTVQVKYVVGTSPVITIGRSRFGD
jgi:hypothetical protein